MKERYAEYENVNYSKVPCSSARIDESWEDASPDPCLKIDRYPIIHSPLMSLLLHGFREFHNSCSLLWHVAPMKSYKVLPLVALFSTALSIIKLFLLPR